MIIVTATLTIAAAIPAQASDNDRKCGPVSGEWMSKDAAKTLATEKGFDVRRVKRDDGCLEIYAIDKDGIRVELYMHPVTGEIVRTKRKS